MSKWVSEWASEWMNGELDRTVIQSQPLSSIILMVWLLDLRWISRYNNLLTQWVRKPWVAALGDTAPVLNQTVDTDKPDPSLFSSAHHRGGAKVWKCFLLERSREWLSRAEFPFTGAVIYNLIFTTVAVFLTKTMWKKEVGRILWVGFKMSNATSGKEIQTCSSDVAWVPECWLLDPPEGQLEN